MDIRLRSCPTHGVETTLKLIAGDGVAPFRVAFALLPDGFCLGGGQPHRRPTAPETAMSGLGRGIEFVQATEENLMALFTMPPGGVTTPVEPAVLLTDGVAGKITVWDVGTPAAAGAAPSPDAIGHCRFSGRDGRWWRPSSVSVNAQIGVSALGRVPTTPRYTKLYLGQHEGSLWFVPGTYEVLLVWGGLWWHVDGNQRVTPASVVIGMPLIFLGQLTVTTRDGSRR